MMIWLRAIDSRTSNQLNRIRFHNIQLSSSLSPCVRSHLIHLRRLCAHVRGSRLCASFCLIRKLAHIASAVCVQAINLITEIMYDFHLRHRTLHSNLPHISRMLAAVDTWNGSACVWLWLSATHTHTVAHHLMLLTVSVLMIKWIFNEILTYENWRRWCLRPVCACVFACAKSDHLCYLCCRWRWFDGGYINENLIRSRLVQIGTLIPIYVLLSFSHAKFIVRTNCEQKFICFQLMCDNSCFDHS